MRTLALNYGLSDALGVGQHAVKPPTASAILLANQKSMWIYQEEI